jgi:hypothetical protein
MQQSPIELWTEIDQIDQLLTKIGPLFVGQSPGLVSVVLADLLATLLAGHPADLRESILKGHVDLVRLLLPAAIAMVDELYPPTEQLGREDNDDA